MKTWTVALAAAGRLLAYTWTVVAVVAVVLAAAGRLLAYTNPCPSGGNSSLSESAVSGWGLVEAPDCMLSWNTHVDRPNWEYIALHACGDNKTCTFTSAGILDASAGSKLRFPLKSDPGSPSTGEVWVNAGAVKVRDNAGSPTTQTLVNTTRAINTTAPLAGGGDFSADRTLTCAVATGSVAGCLASADFTTFNNKVGTSRAINTTAPITGGGNLSADRTIACDVASGSQPGCLAAADWTTFNNKVSGLTGSTSVDLNPGASACTDSSAFAVTSAADGDPCSVGGVNAAWTAHADLHFSCFVSSAGNVKIRACCHNTTACADPGSRTYKVFLQH